MARHIFNLSVLFTRILSTNHADSNESKTKRQLKNITVFYLCIEKTSSTETLIQWQTENKTFKCLRL